MSKPLQSRQVPTLVQGVSQQAPKSRRDTQCEAQFDCINSAVEGVRARPGFDYGRRIPAYDTTNGFFHEIRRDGDERYLVIVTHGQLRVYDITDWTRCTVRFPHGKPYLLSGTTAPRQRFAATTIEDYTFLANKAVRPAMKTKRSPKRPREAIVHFRAGNYATRYQVSITIKGRVYTWSYKTPDNSSAANQAYIATNRLAAALYGAMVYGSQGAGAGTPAATFVNATGSHTPTVPAELEGVEPEPPEPDENLGIIEGEGLPDDGTEPVIPPDPELDDWVDPPVAAGISTTAAFDGVGSAEDLEDPDLDINIGYGTLDAATPSTQSTIRLKDIGFKARLTGSAIHIWRTDGREFRIRTADGAGGAHLIAIKDKVQSFTQLPVTGFRGFNVKVKGESRSAEDDYYVAFEPETAGNGAWEETVAPFTPTTLDPAKMPWILINTGYRQFVFRRGNWGTRVAGDTFSAKNPSFVGRAITDIYSDAGKRLAILTEGSVVYSKARDPFVFFPDTVQAVLADAPIDLEVSAGGSPAALELAVQTGDATFLWAQRNQFAIGGDGDQPFRQDTASAKRSTAFTYARKCRPTPAGQSLYFVTEPGKWANVRDLFVLDGKARANQSVTEHVPKYVRAGVHAIAASDTLGMVWLLSTGLSSGLYVYEYAWSGEERVQSAWHRWRLPISCVVQWAGIETNTLSLVVKRNADTFFLTLDASPLATDPSAEYLTRLDLRVHEEQVTRSYSLATKRTTLTLPYAKDADDPPIKVVLRNDFGAKWKRGASIPIVSHSGFNIQLQGDFLAADFYVGYPITSERTEEGFFIRDPESPVVDALTVAELVLSLSESAFTRTVVTRTQGETTTTEWWGRAADDPDSPLDKVILATAEHRIPVAERGDRFKVRLVNDSPLPSNWLAEEWRYNAELRAAPPSRPRG